MVRCGTREVELWDLWARFIGGIRLDLTYLLTPWCRIFSEKLIVTQLVEQQPALRNPKIYYRAYRSPPPEPIRGASRIQFAPSISILILSSHLRLGLPSGLLHSGLSAKAM
jgi:hypothetical protein